jgi:MFS family permease
VPRAFRSHLLATGVGLALADSSLVTLALPDIVREFDVGITEVAWVLISYNVVLALCAVPAAHLTRRHPRLFCAAGLVIFAAASLACGLAGSFGVLVGARCVQAVGGSFVVATALVLIAAAEGSEQRAVHVWARAGVLGAALGPAIGGILTQVAGWQAIFLAQVPVALLPLLALPRLRVASRPDRDAPVRRPHGSRATSRVASSESSQGSCSWPVASPRSGCCRTRAGRGPCRLSCSSAPASGSRSRH